MPSTACISKSTALSDVCVHRNNCHVKRKVILSSDRCTESFEARLERKVWKRASCRDQKAPLSSDYVKSDASH